MNSGALISELFLLIVTLGSLAFLWMNRREIRRLRGEIDREQVSKGDSGGELGRLRDAVCHLIREKKRLQRLNSGQFSQLEATLGSLQEGVLIVDEDNVVVLANAAMQQIFPHTQEAEGRRLEQVLKSVRLIDYVDAVRAGRAIARQEIEFSQEGKTIWTEVTGTVIESLDEQEGQWALFVLHDITRQKSLENARREFVASVSHELRTPLSVIKGYNETLVEEHNEMPPETRARFLETIQRHAERLNLIVEDLLTLSRLEAKAPGTVMPVQGNLKDFLYGIFDEFRKRPTSEGYKFLFSVPDEIGELWFDHSRLMQVMENLLENARKYSSEGTCIEVNARAEGERVRVAIKDNGIGIPEKDIPHLFERFYRVDKGRSRERGGTGLGLSIVKHIIQLHGGEVGVISTLGEGSEFWFTLPR